MRIKITILFVLVAFCFPSCIASYKTLMGTAKYETSNTVVIKVTKKAKKQKMYLYVSARDQEKFEEITENIVKLFEEWNSK